MCHKKVYYINIKPYIHKIPIDEIVRRFSESAIGKKYFKMFPQENETDLLQHLNLNLNLNKTANPFFIKNKTLEEKFIDNILSKKILHHLQAFFHENSNGNKKTFKKKSRKFNFTKRNRFKPLS